jgi:hypothetical protein
MEEKKEVNYKNLTMGLGAICVILVAALVASIATGGFSPKNIATACISPGEGNSTATDHVDTSALENKVQDYINSNMLPSGIEFYASGIEKAGSFYTVTGGIKQNGTTVQTIEDGVLISSDGEMLIIGSAHNTSVKIEQPAANTTQNTTPKAFDAPDADKPVVKFFVMSFCPYGKQAEAGIGPVAALFGDKAEFEPHYVVYSGYQGGSASYCMENGTLCSMHGIQEVHEDARQLCVYKYQKDKFWDYVNGINGNCTASNIDSCWEGIANETGVDAAEVEKCFNDEGVGLLSNESALDKQYGVSGSPTVFVNDAAYNGGRSPTAYQVALCSGFKSQPSACNQTVDGTTASTGTGGCG